MEASLSSFNTAQREAVLSDAQVLQVLAPPGSGKTKTLTARVAHLIASGLQPWNIIVCTFTVKAAREMQTRIKDIVEESSKIKIGTFHGIALRYIRKHRKLLGLGNAFGVADTSDSTAILRRVLKPLGNTIDASAVRSRISSLKAKGIDCETYAQTEGKRPNNANFLRLYQQYQAELSRSGLLDYDDILLRCIDLLRAHPDCVNSIQAVLVDEFQDTNNVQYELMALFAQHHQKITIVGDPDQSIYGWRSAEIKNLHRMRQRWHDTVTINLQENYRSSGSILTAAQAVIEQDTSRPQKVLQATLSYGHRPVMRKLPSSQDEASWLVEEIKRVQALSGGVLAHKDFAILLRTASLSRVIETSLGSSGIPYRMVGGTKFFDRVEVKIVLDYLRVIVNPSHNEALVRVLNVPPRRIGDKTVESLQTKAQQSGTSVWSLIQDLACGLKSAPVGVSQIAIKGIEQFAAVILGCRRQLSNNEASIVDIIGKVIQKTGLQSYLRGKYVDDFESRWSGVEDLITQASEQMSTPTLEQDHDKVTSEDISTALSDFLANAALAAAVDTAADGTSAMQVTISTMHAAKGLEWPVVFVPACYHGSLPHSRSEDHDEERRLLYVAMTRAQVMLYLSCPLRDGQKQDTVLSSFLSRPDCMKLFDDRGPTLGLQDVQNFSNVLGRSNVDAEAIRLSSANLLRDLDDFWPVDGRPPQHSFQQCPSTRGLEKSAATETTNIDTRVPSTVGFATVRSQLHTLQQQALSSVPNKLAGRSGITSISRERDAGRGKISSFFGTDPSFTVIKTTMQQHSSTTTQRVGGPLMDVTSQTQHGSNMHSTSTYTVRSEPLSKKQKRCEPGDGIVQVHNPYVMLSSSPPVPEEEMADTGVRKTSPNIRTTKTEFKTASTTHLTSYRSATASRRTLGVRRSMHGWDQRRQSRVSQASDIACPAVLANTTKTVT